MKSTSILALSAAFWLVAAGTGVADLCAKCRDGIYISSVGKCVECKAATTSGAFKLCRACSAKLQECEHCRVPLKQEPKPKSGGLR